MRFLSIIALACLAVSCKKKVQPEMSEFNKGCDCAKETSADFLMEERAGFGIPNYYYTNTDSIFGDKSVRFSALEEGASYTWYIGAETLHSREVVRSFPNSMVGQTIPITLVVRKASNRICFPDDDGYDSIVRYLSIAKASLYNNPDTIFLEGSYRMKSPQMSDSVDITIDYTWNSNNRYFNFYNYDGNGTNCVNNAGSTDQVGLNYRQLWVETVVNCGDLSANVHLKLNGEVSMIFSTGGYINGVWVNNANIFNYRGRKL